VCLSASMALIGEYIYIYIYIYRCVIDEYILVVLPEPY